MCAPYSTCIIPENSEGLLFSIKSDEYLYHCWYNTEKSCFVLIKEANNFNLHIPRQLMQFGEKELKRYLYKVTSRLNRIDHFLFFNEELWEQYVGSLS